MVEKSLEMCKGCNNDIHNTRIRPYGNKGCIFFKTAKIIKGAMINKEEDMYSLTYKDFKEMLNCYIPKEYFSMVEESIVIKKNKDKKL
jgi:hypothetical protein